MLSCTGAGYFFGDTDIMGSLPFINSEYHQVVKKKTLPKPKSFYSKRQTSNENSTSTTKQFSFFRVLNDPSLNKMVGLNGEIIKKYNSSPVPIKKTSSKIAVLPLPSSRPQKAGLGAERKSLNRMGRSPGGMPTNPSLDNTGSSSSLVVSKLALRGGDRKKSTPVAPVQIARTNSTIAVLPLPSSMPKKAEGMIRLKNSNRIGRSPGGMPTNPSLNNTGSSGTLAVNKLALRGGVEMVSYVVQVSSFRQWQQAEILRAAMGKKGYAAFIGKTELPDNKGTWYRVYIGRYFNRAGAKMAAERFYREENRQAMVIRQTG